MNSKYKKYGYHFSFVLLLFVLNACTKMDSTYHDFWKDGQNIYPASPDSLKVFSGRNRVQLQWLNIGDPTLEKAVIYWNNRSDSLEFPIEKEHLLNSDTMSVFIAPLSEGSYSFDMFTYDKYGNRSVVANAVGKVYGDTYARALLPRLIDNNSFLDDTLYIQWGERADNSSIGTEIVYKNINGEDVHRIVAADADTTIILDYDNNNSKYFEYRTMFLPDSTAIDTFYTKYDSIRVLGPRNDLSKTRWSITASSYDNRNGRTDRLPEKLIDENTSTNWVNLVGPTQFPHSVIIDMDEVRSEIYGVSLMSSGGNENPRSMSVFTSNDNENWQSFGLMNIQKSKDWQYFDFNEPQKFRYLKLVFEDSYGSNNIIMYEAGVYTR